MAEFASKGVAGAGLGLGIAGTALGLANNGFGNGWFGGWGRNGNGWNGNCGNGCGGYGYNGYSDIGVSEALACRDMEIAQLRARAYSDESDLAVYKYFDGKLKALDDRLCAQEVFNANANGTMKVLADQLAQAQALLASITKTAIPEDVICSFQGRNCGCGTVSQ